ncbi:MAG: hypothetical protein ACRDT6_17235 [Micromonosporaceae bacterium]
MRTIRNPRLAVAVGATLALLGSLAVTTPADAASPTMVHHGTATRISEYPISISAGTRTTLETVKTSYGSDPVLHLLAPTGAQVAMDDNSGPGYAARLSFVASRSGTYTVVVRSRTTTSTGTTQLYRNGAAWQSNVPFGGWSLTLRALRNNERIDTVKLAGGATVNHSLYILKPDGLGIERRTVGGGTGGAAALTWGGDSGDRRVLVGVPRTHTPGAVRLLRNDAGLYGHDTDGDRLGNELEAALGTCSNLTQVVGNFGCSRATDPRDTDGDGIRDEWEVLGRRDGTPHQPLPLWGANPRHKDLFVEVDFAQKTTGETTRKTTPREARDFAAYYGDQVGSPSELRMAVHAATLRNPDGVTGISVHMDIGVTPTDPADRTLYGNWGGYSVVPPASEGKAANANTAWDTYLSPMRRGIFRYALPYASGGGQTPVNGFAWAYGLGSGWLAAHESGHAMGLGHSGPAYATPNVDVNCKPNTRAL